MSNNGISNEAMPNNESKEAQNSEKTWQKSNSEFLLVVVTFVATVAFQAGLNPPGGVWQDDNDPRYEAGKSIMASKHPSLFVTFIAGVTTCLVISVVQILALMSELPSTRLISRNFQYVSLGLVISGMAPAYWSAITAATPQPLMQQVTITLVTNLVVGVVTAAIMLYIQKKYCTRC